MAKHGLSKQQKKRIRIIQAKRLERASERAKRLEEELDVSALGPERAGIVIVHHGNFLLVKDSDGQAVRCLSRQNLGSVVCGDQVIWQQTEPGHGVIIALETRRNVLRRPVFDGQLKPLAANIDQMIIVTAVVPELSELMIDSYLCAAELSEITPIIALNKIDLLDPEAQATLSQRLELYETLGYQVCQVSSKDHAGLDALLEQLRDRVNILVGQSGVGKSSLIRSLIPDMDIRTGEISSATGLGKHTTSSTTLYELKSGGKLIDSPGVRQFRLWPMAQEELIQGFRDLAKHAGKCRFANCEHRVEPGCALKAATESGAVSKSRLERYHQLMATMP